MSIQIFFRKICVGTWKKSGFRKNKCVGVLEVCIRLWCVILDADCGLVDKNDLQCDIDNVIMCVNGKKTNVVVLLKRFDML